MTTTSMSMSQLRDNLADALDQVMGGNPVVVTRRGKADAALIDVDLLEDFLDTRDPELVKKIRKSRESNKLYTLEEAFEDL